MLTEMIEYSRKIKEEMKAIQSEIKKNMQGTNSEGKESGTQINNLEQKEEINIHLVQNEETRVQKNEERLRNLQENFKHFNILIIGVTEGEEEEQKIENLFENTMKENSPIWWKEINRLPESPESSESSKEMEHKEEHTKTQHN